MNYLKLLAFVTLFSGFGFSQELDERLLEKYSKVELQKLKESNAAEYQLMVYALSNGMYVMDFPKGKDVSFETIELNSEEYNFISLKLELTDSNQYFLIQGTQKVLVLKSRYVLENELKNRK